MAQIGHADDCPACRYADLTEEDKALLDALESVGHLRKSPPLEPERPTEATYAILGGLLLALLGCVGPSPVVVVLGGIVMSTGFVALMVQMSGWQARFNEWNAVHETWKTEQTRAWLQQRAKAELWPCPTCGRESCSNRHSETETVLRRRGLFGGYYAESHTDPR